MYYITKSIKGKAKRTGMYYLTLEEKREVMTDCGDSAVILYEFYISKGGVDDYDFSDGKAGRALGWTDSKVQRIRLVLEKKHFFRKLKDHNTWIVYIGKDQVDKSYE